MTDLNAVTAALTSLKAAMEFLKALQDGSVSLGKAELKLKLAETIGDLAEAKIELVTIQEALTAKDQQIAGLTEAFEQKDEIKREGDAYYRVRNGKPTGQPLCLRCWEVDHKQRQLVRDASDFRVSIRPTRDALRRSFRYDSCRLRIVYLPS